MIRATVSCPVRPTYRVSQLAGLFDLSLEQTARESYAVEVPAAQEDWSIGLIVGPSGSGKSTIAREAFGAAVHQPAEWAPDTAVIDGFGDLPVKRVAQVLTAVGLSSPPAWVKPYAVLSNGEKFRCDLARALLAGPELVVFDEFTSVVDRTVAKVGSAAIARAIRSGVVARKFVAVSCHYDIAQWLGPDWVVDMARQELARGRLSRLPIRIELFRCRGSAWRLFARHHYLNANLHPAAQCYLATWENHPAAFCAVLPLTGRAGRDRISRIVVLPDYQGIGIGSRVLDAVASLRRARGRRVNLTTSHPSMIAALRRGRSWKCVGFRKTGFQRRRDCRQRGAGSDGLSSGRPVASFEFIGEAG
jgi:ABC-type ATPase with predicted acetyltransferase domain